MGTRRPGAGIHIVAAALALAASSALLLAVELKPATAAAFARYVAATEARIDDELRRGRFLLADAQPAAGRQKMLGDLRRGDLVIQRLTTRVRAQTIPIPDGYAHHWIGLVFMPGATLQAAVSMAQDYNRHAEFFGEVVKRSRLVRRDGQHFRIAQRYMLKRILTGVVDVESEVDYAPVSATRLHIRARSTRVREVEDAFTPRERLLPPGNDSGYLWRVNSYWRIEETQGGTYLQVEWLSLSRSAPFGLGWLIEPIVLGLSRDSLRLTLTSARRILSR